MKTYEDLRKDGFTPTEALELMEKNPLDYETHKLSTFYTMKAISDFIGIPDIALNDYDYLEDELLF